MTELALRGHDVRVWEPVHAWSKENLVRDHGREPLEEVSRHYSHLRISEYGSEEIDSDDRLDEILADCDLVLVHEWNDHKLIGRIGEAKRRHRFTLLFHDTHHRSVSDEASMSAYDLRHYDAVIAFGAVIRDLYLRKKWTQRAFTLHEAADVHVFTPRPDLNAEVDLVWIGNWGDDEREAELHEFLIEPVRRLRISARVYGVRYPDRGIQALRKAGIEYRGWLPNHLVPEAFGRARVTVHIPRRPYATALPGIPTIRPFEALACGIPLVSAPWHDTEGLFRTNKDYLPAKTGDEMRDRIYEILSSPPLCRSLRESGRARVLDKHTCAHRAEELLSLARELRTSENTLAPMNYS
jgi:spore maturation protein CgeB